ncbi:MAG: hypothetical protein ABI390_03655 [Daejeonella sp.]
MIDKKIKANVDATLLEDDGTFPNNPYLTFLIYKDALELKDEDKIDVIENLFKSNKWANAWRNGIFDYHHYHSNTHEVLGVFSGTAKVQIGGPHGIYFEIKRSDVLIIPAGVAHKCLKCSKDFMVVGAYPDDLVQDMNYGKEGERPGADENIANVKTPEFDPVFGKVGPLKQHW